jgi:ribosomal protein S18 acetylase RimI-like enzyme
MDKPVVRKANKKDIASINKLNFEMHNYLAKLVRIKLSKKELNKEKINESDLKKERYYVAIVGNKVVGFIAFGKKILEDEWHGKYLYLHEIAVTKKFRGKGIGKKLFQNALDYAKKNKLNIKADTFAKNKNTIKFNKKLGFKPLSINFILDLNKRLKI